MKKRIDFFAILLTCLALVGCDFSGKDSSSEEESSSKTEESSNVTESSGTSESSSNVESSSGTSESSPSSSSSEGTSSTDPVHQCELHEVSAVESTCLKQGNNKYYACDCGKVYKDSEGKEETTKEAETLPLTNHKGGTATCTEKAECDVCHQEYGDVLGHQKATSWSKDEDYHWHECTHECNEKLDKEGHNFDDGSITTEPTSSEAGVFTYECEDCGQTKTTPIYLVSFVNDNGDVIQTSKQFAGSDIKAPEEDPEKDATAQYTYEFEGWTLNDEEVNEFGKVNGCVTYVASYDSTVNKYSVKFLNADETILSGKTYEYGATVILPETNPTKADEGKYEYTFDGWADANGNLISEIPTVSKAVTYYPHFIQSVKVFTVKFLDAEGQEISSTSMDYEDQVTFNGTNPIKASTIDKDYVFVGWKAGDTTYTELPKVYTDYTFTPVYEETVRKYDVTIKYEGISEENKVEKLPYHQLSTLTFEDKVVESTTYTANVPTLKIYVDGNAEITIYYSKVEKYDGTSISTELEGNGTLESPYLIKTGADLAYVKAQTKLETSNTFEGKYFKLVNSIDLDNKDLSFAAAAATFNGTFDGNNCVIQNFAGTEGLFGWTGSKATIKNLSLTGAISVAHGSIGAFASTANSGTKIINCNNYVSVTSTAGHFVGGYVGGGNPDMENCANYGKVTASHTGNGNNRNGGFLGNVKFDGTVNFTSCYNFAEVNGKSECGGLIGGDDVANTTVNMTNCYNFGDVHVTYSTTNLLGGGIFGGTNKAGVTVNLTNCANYGQVTGTIYTKTSTTLASKVGGIVGGGLTAGTTFIIDGCDNYGEVLVESHSGGIIGYYTGATTSKLEVKNCNNYGYVGKYVIEGRTIASTAIGGIVGSLAGAGEMEITNCKNSGEIISDTNLAGIVGYTEVGTYNLTISNCINNGYIHNVGNPANLYASGIVAWVRSKGLTKVIDCVNNGKIESNKSGAGGIVSATGGTTNLVIERCVNNAEVTCQGATAGAILGFTTTATDTKLRIVDCVNNGNVHSSTAFGYIVGNVACTSFVEVAICGNTDTAEMSKAFGTSKATELEETNHSYTKTVYSWEGNVATAKLVCEHCEKENKVEQTTGEYVKDSDPDCTHPELGHYIASFDTLGNTASPTKSVEVGDSLGHTGGEATCGSKAVCDRCHQEYGEVDASKHTGGTADCGHKAVCDNCHQEYGEYDLSKHNISSEWTYSETKQWHTCANCSTHFDEQARVYKVTVKYTGITKENEEHNAAYSDTPYTYTFTDLTIEDVLYVANKPTVKVLVHNDVEITINYSTVSVYDGTSVSSSLSGEGTEASPYLITSGADLKYINEQVSLATPNSFDGKYFKLSNSIDMNNVAFAIGSYTSTAKKSFGGIFDGNNCIIRNVNTVQGLFAYTNANARISNLSISGSATNTNKDTPTGGFVGASTTGTTITNCYNYVNVDMVTSSGTNYTGGFVGNGTVVITGCENYGSVKQTGTRKLNCGGFVGGLNGGSIIDSINFGEVLGGSATGGFTGGATKATFTNDINFGNVTATYTTTNTWVGGICGLNGKNGVLSFNNCVNYGTIIGDNTICGSTTAANGTAGILGGMFNTGTATITNCVNNGTITGNTVVAGIVGASNAGIEATNKLTITNCVNNGKITSDGKNATHGYAAGILGWSRTKSTSGDVVSNCVNNGEIYAIKGDTSSSSSIVGGIVGATGGTSILSIDKCSNNGYVHSEKGNSVGGILGATTAENDTTLSITDCTNHGKIQGATAIGGILGNDDAESFTSITFTGNTNDGEIVGKSSTGQMIGKKDCSTLTI